MIIFSCNTLGTQIINATMKSTSMVNEPHFPANSPVVPGTDTLDNKHVLDYKLF